ncbi:NUDIX domain-containing protein [Rhodococcus sp. Z13]|uniref:NUDIX domain-containing protein n=1 Tax=Rhodococcus sacchari TaxID=2962047 RepID=A0ACD4DGL4_9NOCA|nr:NUDIX domain-containing protein [Rhodococcus sp. Z13]UYP19166.1 NUDIX domain-containing protein [Rhodococcus sp. Z13]
MTQEQVTEGRVIRVSAVVLRDADGQVLTVRKRNTSRFMLPGGKPDPGETPAETAVRECAEELGATLSLDALRLVGVFDAEAANEPGYRLEGTVYEHPLVEIGGAAAEIAETRWLDPAVLPLPGDLAPLLEHHVLPALGYR